MSDLEKWADTVHPDTPRSAQSAVSELRQALVHLDDQRAELAERGDVEGLAWGLSDLELVIGDMRAIERAGRANVAALMDAEWESMGKRGRPRREIPNLGVVEVWGGSERKNWESEKLLRKLILRGITSDYGEVREMTTMELVDVIYEILVSCLPVTASLQWRVGQHGKGTGLRGQGIDPADFCDEVEAPRLAKIPRQPKEAT